MKVYLIRNESSFNIEENAFAFFRQEKKSKRDERRTLKQRYDRKAPKESPEDFLILGVWE